jgi:2'-5' RNA ligase
MHRVVAALRLLAPKRRDVGPLRISADSGLSPLAIGEFLDACLIAVQKIRAFGLKDDQFGGQIRLAARDSEELANGRYMSGSDRSFIFYPQIRGVPDMLWTIIHELGHRVWYKVLTDDERVLWSIILESLGEPISPEAAKALAHMAIRRPGSYPMWFYFQRHFGADAGNFEKWLLTKKFASDELPTDYGNAAPAEAWADAFADAILGRSHRGMPLRRSGAFLKRVFISIIDRVRDRHPMTEEALLEEEDPDFLQSQVDLPALDRPIATWIGTNLDQSEIIKLPGPAHVTLVYGLDKRDLHRIQEVAENFARPVRVVVGRLNYFDAPEHDVLYAEAVGAGLVELHNELTALPHTRPQNHPEYIPHVTIAYVKKGVAKKYVETTPFRAIYTRTSFTLLDSLGDQTAILLTPPGSSEPRLVEASRGS